jgi:hypothetical protein
VLCGVMILQNVQLKKLISLKLTKSGRRLLVLVVWFHGEHPKQYTICEDPLGRASGFYAQSFTGTRSKGHTWTLTHAHMHNYIS